MEKISQTGIKGNLSPVSAPKVDSQVRAPTILTARRPTLRILGTHVTLLENIRKKAQEDLDIQIEMMPGGDPEILHRASTHPDSFDIYEQWSNSIKVLWRANAIRAIDTRKIQQWDKINNLSKTGRLTPNARIAEGDSPHKILYIQPNQELGTTPTEQVTFLPYVHNADSFGYNSAVLPIGIPYETESWAWLLDPAYRGKVALINEPSIGTFDAALAARAKNLMTISDIGNMTRKEIDQLINILLQYKKDGHFRGFWTSVPRSVDLMKNGEVIIESMFSPAVSELKSIGVPCIYAAPKEGYRAWHGVMCISTRASPVAEGAAYEYMNWWLSGWPGALIARQGYYISNPENSKPFMNEGEWDYWYEGKPAATELVGSSGAITVNKGEVRTGGSYLQRFSNIAVWNSVMDQYEYLLLRWKELLVR